MKAMRFHAYGGPDVLCLESIPKPVVEKGNALVRVCAAAVNPADWQIRSGYYRDFLPLALPFTPGADLSGVVEALGDGVADFRPGDAVFAMTDMVRGGGYAEYVTVRAEALASAPRSLPLAEAASLPLAALTAWKALFDVGGLVAGQRVLIHAGAGGVGMFAIQFAHRAGAHITTTASTENHDLLRQLGADRAIDYRLADFASRAYDQIDLVIDTVGGETREKSWSLLRPGGMLTAVAMPPADGAEAIRRGLRSATVNVTPDGARLAEFARMIDAGELVTLIDSEFSLEEAAAAHRRSESRRARGKVLLRVS